MPHRRSKWLAAALAAGLAPPLLAALWLAVFGWNWARGPLQDLALQKTGRELLIRGDLGLKLAWPTPRVRALSVSYANPPWATAPQMLTAEAVEVTVDLPELLRGRLAFPEVRLTKPRVFLEQASGGRKTWLFDRLQTDEQMRIPIGRVLLDEGAVTYIHPQEHTAIHVALSTTDAPAAQPGGPDGSVAFTASGQFRAQALVAKGSGGAVLRWRDESLPYPLKVQATVGRTRVRAEGSVTGLRAPKALDLQLEVQGDSLASLFPLIGIALPPTPAYQASGHLIHGATRWRYEAFAGRVGESDIAGSLQLDTGPTRPVLSGALTSRRLDLADLAPAVGVHKTAPAAAAPAATRVLPDVPLDTARWASLDADVTLQASTLLGPLALPLEGLQLRLRLEDRRLSLDPLRFGLAGGQLTGEVTLDGRTRPIHGFAKVQLRGALLGRLLPKADPGMAGIGHLDGDAELRGQGASLGGMLATADGRLSLVAQHGEISRLLMERVGLHLLEILRLKLTGDQRVGLNCAVADFGVTHGVMQVRALVLDTEINTLVGGGSIDLAQETLDLTIKPSTKVNSLVALRSPSYIKGSFSHPTVELDSSQVAARGAGALLLALLNPLLALIPLFEAGPGLDGPCVQLVRSAQSALPRTTP